MFFICLDRDLSLIKLSESVDPYVTRQLRSFNVYPGNSWLSALPNIQRGTWWFIFGITFQKWPICAKVDSARHQRKTDSYLIIFDLFPHWLTRVLLLKCFGFFSPWCWHKLVTMDILTGLSWVPLTSSHQRSMMLLGFQCSEAKSQNSTTDKWRWMKERVRAAQEKYGTAVDIYAFGMVLLEMIGREQPWSECEMLGIEFS